jgi:hypothetical protein
VCGKSGFGCTIVDGSTIEDHDIDVPANISDRGAQLTWLAEEAQRLVEAAGCDAVCVQLPGSGRYNASAERHEVEGAVQIGVHKAGVATQRLTTEGVRSELGVPRGAGAYKKLLTRPDVKARSNDGRRHQYLLALAVQP